MSGDVTARDSARRIAVVIEYDGTAYRGSQYQDNGPSIQSELEAAIAKLTGAAVRAAFAGRTDAGAHAIGQVAAFAARGRLSAGEYVRGLNHFLPSDIAVRRAVEVAAEFDPRRDARRRVYRYEVDTRPGRSPLTRGRMWQTARPLDDAAMRGAAARLLGTQDFAAFAGPYDGSTVRTLERCDIAATGCGVAVEMEARSFLPHQVRRTVGALAEVGFGRSDADRIADLLERAEPSSAGPSAPACGLYLLRIEYDGLDFGPLEGDGRD